MNESVQNTNTFSVESAEFVRHFSFQFFCLKQREGKSSCGEAISLSVMQLNSSFCFQPIATLNALFHHQVSSNEVIAYLSLV